MRCADCRAPLTCRQVRSCIRGEAPAQVAKAVAVAPIIMAAAVIVPPPDPPAAPAPPSLAAAMQETARAIETARQADGWTEWRVILLKKLWLEGLSASQIAKQLRGGLSRNAVIGKVHRLGLEGRATPSLQRMIRTNRPVRPVAIQVHPIVPPAPSTPNLFINQGRVLEGAPDAPLPPLRVVQADTPPRHWLTRKYRECAWPVGEPERPADQFSCCAPTAEGATYCEAHVALRSSGKRWGIYGGGAKELERALRKHVA